MASDDPRHSLLTAVLPLVWPQEGLAVGGATVLVWEGPESLDVAEVELEYGGMLRFVVAVHDGGAAAEDSDQDPLDDDGEQRDSDEE